MRKLKVYGISSQLLGKTSRAVAAVRNQEQFAKLIGSSVGYISKYGSETGNDKEHLAAYSSVGDLFVQCPCCDQWVNWSKKKSHDQSW